VVAPACAQGRLVSADLRIRLTLPRAGFTLKVDLSLPAQGITVLFGPSGSGKTSVLRAVAGLERAREAQVRLGEQVWQDDARGLWVPPHRRCLGYVFQEASLLDHLDVMGNLRYGLLRTHRAAHAGSSPAEGLDTALLDKAIDLLGISHLLSRRTPALSGGERQRVAIARALAAAPQLLLLDEPMAAIDAGRRQEILPWLERLRDEAALPMLYVTHSTDELVRLADQVVLIEQGQVQAQGSAWEVVALRHGALVAGEEPACLLACTVVERSPKWQLARVDFEGGHLWLRDSGASPGHRLRLRVWARDVSLATRQPQDTSVQNILPVVVSGLEAADHPSQVLVRLRCGQAELLSRITRRACEQLGLEPGRPAWAMIKAVAVVS